MFLVLPSRCFPRDTRERFEIGIMEELGFEIVLRESTPKVFSTCFRAVREPELLHPLTFSDGAGLLDVVVVERAITPPVKRIKESVSHYSKRD